MRTAKIPLIETAVFIPPALMLVFILTGWTGAYVALAVIAVMSVIFLYLRRKHSPEDKLSLSASDGVAVLGGLFLFFLLIVFYKVDEEKRLAKKALRAERKAEKLARRMTVEKY